MTEERRSIAFDRAAEYYDATRSLSPQTQADVAEVLAAELRGRGRALEIGVGTGQIALPLHEAGIPIVGIDLAASMLRKLREKAGGRAPFPLVVGDATLLPFSDEAFGGAIGRHVLHLIPNWRGAVRELVRTVRPGGVLLLNIGVPGGPWEEVDERLEEQLGEAARRVGIEPQRHAELDALVAELGGRHREVPVVWQPSDLTLERYFRQVEQGLHSWTWNVQPETLRRAVERVSAWAEARFGGLDGVLEDRLPIVWRAYDLG